DAKAGLNVDLAPTFLDNYTRLLGNDLFWQSFQIGIIWAFTTTFLQYILGLGLAIMLEQRLYFLWLARTLALVPWAIRPVIVAIVSLNFIWNFNSFGLVYVLTEGGPGGKTMVPALFAYNEGFKSGHFGYAAAMGNVMVIVVLALLYIYLRQGRRGVE